MTGGGYWDVDILPGRDGDHDTASELYSAGAISMDAYGLWIRERDDDVVDVASPSTPRERYRAEQITYLEYLRASGELEASSNGPSSSDSSESGGSSTAPTSSSDDHTVDVGNVADIVEGDGGSSTADPSPDPSSDSSSGAGVVSLDMTPETPSEMQAIVAAYNQGEIGMDSVLSARDHLNSGSSSSDSSESGGSSTAPTPGSDDHTVDVGNVADIVEGDGGEPATNSPDPSGGLSSPSSPSSSGSSGSSTPAPTPGSDDHTVDVGNVADIVEGDGGEPATNSPDPSGGSSSPSSSGSSTDAASAGSSTSSATTLSASQRRILVGLLGAGGVATLLARGGE